MRQRQGILLPVVFMLAVAHGKAWSMPDEPSGASSSKMYPDLAAQTVRIEAMGLRVGTYRVSVVGVNGMEESRQEVMITEDEASVLLDVAEIPSGYYAIRINDGDDRTIGIYPIIITC